MLVNSSNPHCAVKGASTPHDLKSSPSGAFANKKVVVDDSRQTKRPSNDPNAASSSYMKKPRYTGDAEREPKPLNIEHLKKPPLGYGGFCTVFEVDTGDGKSVAVKIPNNVINVAPLPGNKFNYSIKPFSILDHNVKERKKERNKSNEILEKESNLLKSFNSHDNIIKFAGMYQINQWYCLAMERYEMNLSFALLKESLYRKNHSSIGFPDLKNILRMYLDLLSAISTIYSIKNIFHSDLACKNLLVSPLNPETLNFTKIVVADLGAAATSRRFDGTCHYLAPELSYPESLPASESSEVFALGFILLQLLVKEPITNAWSEKNNNPLPGTTSRASREYNETTSAETSTASQSFSCGGTQTSTGFSPTAKGSGRSGEKGSRNTVDSVKNVSSNASIPHLFELLNSQELDSASEKQSTKHSNPEPASHVAQHSATKVAEHKSADIDESLYLPIFLDTKEVDIVGIDLQRFPHFQNQEGTLEYEVWSLLVQKMMEKNPDKRLSLDTVIATVEGILKNKAFS